MALGIAEAEPQRAAAAPRMAMACIVVFWCSLLSFLFFKIRVMEFSTSTRRRVSREWCGPRQGEIKISSRAVQLTNVNTIQLQQRRTEKREEKRAGDRERRRRRRKRGGREEGRVNNRHAKFHHSSSQDQLSTELSLVALHKVKYQLIRKDTCSLLSIQAKKGSFSTATKPAKLTRLIQSQLPKRDHRGFFSTL